MQISLKFVRKVPVNNKSALVKKGLAPNRRQAIIWNNDSPVYWRTYASLGFNELKVPEVGIYVTPLWLSPNPNPVHWPTGHVTFVT